MLSVIEKFVLGGNDAHDLIGIEKGSSQWIIQVSPCYNTNIKKKFVFNDVALKYEEYLLDEDEVLEFPIPIIGFDSFPLPNGRWRFCLNAADIEWGFESDWPSIT